MSDQATAPTAPAATPEGAPTGAPAEVQAAPPTGAPADAGPETTIAVEAEAGEKAGTFSYGETGDKGLDMALRMVGNAGYGPDSDAVKAAVEGDFSLLRAELAAKQVPGWEAHILLAEKAYERISTETKTRRAADLKAVQDVAGGEEQWGAIQKWAGENAEPAEAEALKDMLGKGGKHAVIAAGFLASQYARAQGAEPTQGAGPNAAASAGQPVAASNALSPSEYGRAMVTARASHNPREGAFEASKAYKDLADRRSRFRG